MDAMVYGVDVALLGYAAGAIVAAFLICGVAASEIRKADRAADRALPLVIFLLAVALAGGSTWEFLACLDRIFPK